MGSYWSTVVSPSPWQTRPPPRHLLAQEMDKAAQHKNRVCDHYDCSYDFCRKDGTRLTDDICLTTNVPEDEDPEITRIRERSE